MTPHLSAMSPLDAVSLQMAAALASDFASPCPPALVLLPAPDPPTQRYHRDQPGAPYYHAASRGLNGHSGFRHGAVGLPPVQQAGPAMGTTSSAGVIAAARRAVAAAAGPVHGEFRDVGGPQQQQQHQQHQQYSTAHGYRAEVSSCTLHVQ